ncbi:hypothetical protein BT96DRAFT_1071833 [Gymnopus androsaceus JB14]|uniref:Uncharacterized protein n=1 Tax=Gymnopus androsaceus JB14 TaxID=1447944 RepID=A0A6A4GT37_9AGAR|nr:hypothetical protein BT96DRAFT_1071833 [Gymnopus androsaceus JB14]
MLMEREERAREFVQGDDAANDFMENYKVPEEPVKREWMIEAEKMVEMFKETRNLFSAARACFRIATDQKKPHILLIKKQMKRWLRDYSLISSCITVEYLIWNMVGEPKNVFHMTYRFEGNLAFCTVKITFYMRYYST